MSATIEELVIADDPATWRRLGFAVARETCIVGHVRVRLAGREAGEGILAWTLRDAASDDFDGVPTTIATGKRPPRDSSPAHPNCATRIDHVVVLTPDLDRTLATLERAGLEVRRIAEVPGGPVRQAFFRLGEVILEVVGPVLERERAGFWGLVCTSKDIESTAQLLGENLGPVKQAVQAGRRISTVNRSAGSSVPMAFISD
jgi:catechol 2,3-dioxygenase-like lactoylglutathione lyase family enzyme